MSVTNTPLTSHTVTVKNPQGAVVGTLVTNSVTGHAEMELPPGEYIVEVATLAGYTLESNGLIEHGNAPIVTTTLITTGVTITSAEDTTINAKFTNAV